MIAFDRIFDAASQVRQARNCKEKVLALPKNVGCLSPNRYQKQHRHRSKPPLSLVSSRGLWPFLSSLIPLVGGLAATHRNELQFRLLATLDFDTHFFVNIDMIALRGCGCALDVRYAGDKSPDLNFTRDVPLKIPGFNCYREK